MQKKDVWNELATMAERMRELAEGNGISVLINLCTSLDGDDKENACQVLTLGEIDAANLSPDLALAVALTDNLATALACTQTMLGSERMVIRVQGRYMMRVLIALSTLDVLRKGSLQDEQWAYLVGDFFIAASQNLPWQTSGADKYSITVNDFVDLVVDKQTDGKWHARVVVCTYTVRDMSFTTVRDAKRVALVQLWRLLGKWEINVAELIEREPQQ